MAAARSGSGGSSGKGAPGNSSSATCSRVESTTAGLAVSTTASTSRPDKRGFTPVATAPTFAAAA
jgi:hypothetical protein